MTDKVFLIGLGGAGTEIVRNIRATADDLFVYRCLDVTLNGSVTEENHDPAWAKFFDPSIPSLNLFYNFRQMTSDRLKDPSVLHSSLEKNCRKYSLDYQVALICGLGQTIGATSIVTFAAALSHNTKLNQPSSINCAAFGTTPFDFEGDNIKKTSQETIAGLRNILPEAKIRILNNQDLMLGSRDLTSSDGNIILHNAVKDQITTYFSLDKGEPIVKASVVRGLPFGETYNKGPNSITEKTRPDGSRKRNGQSTYTYANGDKYVGESKDDRRNGQGTDTYVNGDKYVGEWKDDKPHGQGTYTYANGDKYVGEWKNGIKNGQGTLTFGPNSQWAGDKYVGEFKDSEKNGQGTYNHANGDKYVGEFRDGKQSGRGASTFTGGTRHEGAYKYGKKNGKGTLTSADGSVYEGFWKDNEPAAGKWAKVAADGTVYECVLKNNKLVAAEWVKVAPRGDTSTKSKVPSHVLPDLTPNAEEASGGRSVVKEKQKLLPKFLKSVFKLSAYATFIFAVMLGGFIAIKGYELDDQRLHAAITQPSALVKIGSEGLVLDEAVKCNCERTLKPSELPETFKQALIAIEDKRFYQHIGFDIVSVGRAILSFGTRGGGSTIEMQLVKNSIAQPKNDIIRKISELIFAYRINHIFEKDDIVRLYASRVNFGNIGATRINGLRSAAGYYFGKKPENITIEEAAILVAILKNPNAYDPIKKRANNLKRAKAVLTLLVANGQAGERSIENIEKYMPKRGNVKPYRDRYTEDLIKKEIEKLQLAAGKYRFILSIDPIAQMQALNVLDKAVRSERSRGVERASLVSLDKNGAIKAIIGGQDYLKSSYNLATQAKRQAASTMKIVTYLSALERGHNKETRVFDDPSKIKRFKARNSNRKYAGATTLENCFAKSKNVCTYYIAEQLTSFEHLSEMSYRLHLTSKNTKGDSIVLGAAETTLLKNTAAFASIKNRGFHTEPYLIRFVLGEYGGLVYEHSAGREYVFSEKVAAKMTELLDKVVSPDGTANKALIPGHKTFGKTGTSQNNRDAWFVGFSEHGITTGVWVGPSDDGFMRGVSGGNVPSQIFKKFNQNLYERYEFCSPNFMMQSSGYGRDINC